MKTKKKKGTNKRALRGPVARLPLPKKGEKRHGDRTKYERHREKERLRRELER
jgi:hypothetical protein